MFLQTSFQKCSSRSQMFFRSSRPEVFCNKGALRDFAKFTENTCARTSLLLKLQAKVSNFIYKETLAQVFPVNFARFLRTNFLTEHHWWLFLVLQNRFF